MSSVDLKGIDSKVLDPSKRKVLQLAREPFESRYDGQIDERYG